MKRVIFDEDGVVEKIPGRKIRVYFKPLPKNPMIPKILNLECSPQRYRTFINHVVRNHPSKNWIFFRHVLSEENMDQVLFAFKVVWQQLNPSSIGACQVDANVKQFKKALDRIYKNNTNEWTRERIGYFKKTLTKAEHFSQLSEEEVASLLDI